MANAEDDPVSVLRGIVGLSREACAAMLSRAGGDVAAAVNRHFAAHDPRGDAPTVAASPKRPPSASARSKSTKRGRRESADALGGAQRSLLGFLRPEPETRGDDVITREAVAVEDADDVDVAPSASAPSASAPSDPGVPTLALHTTRAIPSGAASDPGDPWPPPAHPSSDDRAPYALVAHLLDRLESTSKRLDKAAALASAFLRVLRRAPNDLLPVVYLTLGRVADAHDGVELGVGHAAVAAAVAEVTGASRRRVSDVAKRVGDLGDAAAQLAKGQVTLRRPTPLTAAETLETLRNIAAESGAGSARRRASLVAGLLRRAKPRETRYLARTLVKNMRVGANRTSVLHALAKAAEEHDKENGGGGGGGGGETNHGDGDGAGSARGSPASGPDPAPSRRVPPKAKSGNKAKAAEAASVAASNRAAGAAVQRAYSLCPSLETLVPALVEGGVAGVVRECRVRPGTPVRPMLASITAGAADATTRALAGGAAGGRGGGGAGRGDPPETVGTDRWGSVGTPGDGHAGGFDPDGAAGGPRTDPGSSAAAPGLDSNREGARDATGTATAEAETGETAETATETDAAFLAEYKYDGVRAQIHLVPPAGGSGEGAREGRARGLPPGWRVAIFSRNCEDRTAAFPDVVEAFVDVALGGSGFCHDAGLIVDAEIVGIDRETGKLRAFQDLSSRPRGGAGAGASLGPGSERPGPGVDACAFVFDVLHAGAIDEDAANGIRTHDLSLRERRARLARALPGLGRHPGRFELATSREIRGVAGGDATVNAEAVEEVSAIVLESIDAACEGVMLKRLDGPGSAYAPSARADAWLKLKRDYVAELRDSLDLVPIGAWRGVGRKAGWYSPFLLAVYDPETETYASMCRCMSGFTDAFYVDRTAKFGAEPILATKKPAYYETLETPDAWFLPTETWEIRGADLTLSPKHLAAAGARHAVRGISLRFPRFVGVREDKSPADASGPAEVLALYDQQEGRRDGQEDAAARRLEAMRRVKEEKQGEREEDEEDDEEDEEGEEGEEGEEDEREDE